MRLRGQELVRGREGEGEREGGEGRREGRKKGGRGEREGGEKGRGGREGGTEGGRLNKSHIREKALYQNFMPIQLI